MQKSDDQNQPTSFDAFRKRLYRYMDALANQANLRAQARVVESRELKIEMALLLALARH